MSQQKEWLVKSAGDVRGPYSYDEIVERIQTKEIILVDEIAKSFGRWKYVRDEGVFEKVILELQNRDELKGDKTFTNSDTDAITQDIADHVVNFSRADAIENQIQDHFQKSEQKKESQKKQYQESEIKPVSSYVYEKDSSLSKDKKRIRIWSLLGVALVVISFSGFFYLRGTHTSGNYDEQKKIAIRYFELAQFDLSKKSFEKLLSQNPTDDEVKYLNAYSNLYLGDTLFAEKQLKELQEKNSRYQHQVFNLLGVIQLKNYNLSEAKDFFDNALKLSPQYVPAFYNKGIVDFLENRFLEAHQNFSQAMVHGGLDGVILLMNVELLVNNGALIMSEQEVKQRAQELAGLIRKHIQSFEIYEQELLIGLAALYAFLDQKENVLNILDQAIQVEPELTQQHVFDISFYRDVMTWNRIHGWVRYLKDFFPSDKNLLTLHGYSMFKGAEKIEGKSYIEGRLEPNFTHPIDHVMNAYILWSLGRDSESEVALMSIPDNKWNTIAYNLKAKICFKKLDYQCSKQYYEKSLTQRKGNIVSLVGLSNVFSQLSNPVYARDALNEAYKISPYFKPTLDARFRMEFQK